MVWTVAFQTRVGVDEKCDQVVQGERLIALYLQQVVTAAFANAPDDIFLSAHRVVGDGTSF